LGITKILFNRTLIDGVDTAELRAIMESVQHAALTRADPGYCLCIFRSRIHEFFEA
jgi:hypothetical protein